MNRNKETCVYVIKSGDTNIYKIGISNNIDKRLEGMQSGNHQDLIVVKTKYFVDRDFAEAYETLLHSEFLHKNIKREWFKLNEQDLNRIDKILEINKSLKELRLKKRKNRKYNNPKRVALSEKFKPMVEINKTYNTNEIEQILEKLYNGNKEQVLNDLIFRKTNSKNSITWIFKRLCKLSGYDTKWYERKFIKKKRVSLIKVILPETNSAFE